jgi:hypothetical protein
VAVSSAEEWEKPVQAITQHLKCASHLRFDRLHGEPKLARDLAVRETALAAHGKDEAAPLRQLIHGIVHGE